MLENGEQASEHITQDTPDSPRSPKSERMAAPDEGSLEPGKGAPHEDEEVEDDEGDEPGERRIAIRAEAFNQNDGKGEFSQQREVLKPQYSLGFPADDD